jgi:GNAT superfamily N-acetyltransferase
MNESQQQLTLQIATQDDQPGIIQLIDQVYAEYADRVCLEGAESDLLDLQTHYFAKGGAFVVLKYDQQIVGTHAALPIETSPAICTFRRLYLQQRLRGSGHGARLMQWAIDWALDRRFDRIEFWSDTRFEHAHRFFHKFGFVTDHTVRQMDDGVTPYQEYLFTKELRQA